MQGERDTAGRSTAITFVTPVRRWWALWLRVDFAVVALLKRLMRQPGPSRPVRRLSFISFARWTLVERIPAQGRLRRGRKLPHPYMVFQSNFNGATAEYFEAFARGLKWRMRGLWGGAYGMPDPTELNKFSDHIHAHWIPAEHYYCAYPHASTKIVLAALHVRREFDEFAARIPQLDPAAFRDEFDAFIARVQTRL